MPNTSVVSRMSTELGRTATGALEDGESVGGGTVCSNASTYGSVGALVGNRQGHPARRATQDIRHPSCAGHYCGGLAALEMGAR